MSSAFGVSRRVICAAMALAVLAMECASAATSFDGLTFPDQVGGAQLGQTEDFESRRAGLGYGVSYQKPGWAIDIYIYDLGLSSIPDDATSEVVKAQLKKASGDILALEKRGAYADVRHTGSFVIKGSDGRARFGCEDFTYLRQDMGKVDSYLCVTGWQNKFIKFRLTTAHDAGSAAAARRFMQAWLPVLWP